MAKLSVDVGIACKKGVKAHNEDCAGARTPDEDYVLDHKGIALAVADGVSSAEAGREASHTAIERFIEEYYQTPDTWSAAHAGEKILSTLNLRLYRRSHEFTNENKGYLCTFSGLVLKSRTAHWFHVGDSRVYCLEPNLKSKSDTSFSCLTRDHKAALGDGKTFLARALGMDNRLHVDYGHFNLQRGQRLLVTSDGVHEFVDDEHLHRLLAASEPAQAIAEKLVQTALNNGSDDNVTAVVGIIEDIPEENLDDYSAKLTRLPFPPDLDAGMRIDGFVVERALFASARSQLYLVHEEHSGEHYVMKTPSQNYVDDMNYIDRFVQEEWIGSRIHSPFVVKVIRQTRPRNYLYYLMEWVPGESLDKWMVRNRFPSPKRAIGIVKQIAAGLQAFHDNEALHQDLKPANIIIDEHDTIKIVDFGSVFVAGLAEIDRPIKQQGALGTASYSDPHYLLGENPGIQGDVYSLATITYELFTGHLPYGDKVENCRTAFDYDRLRYRSASQYNPVIPTWFDRALEKGVAFDLETRYQTLQQLIQDLTHPNPEFLKEDPVEENKASTLLFWKLLSGFWFVSFLLLIFLFTRGA